ncbi:MAG: type II toxin-antitoxin system Phd/YefM family antitoxin [Parachlamydiaceae bacterium]
MATNIPFSDARSDLTQIVNHVAFAHERFVLTRNGKEVAAIISIDDLALLEELEDSLDLKIAKQVDREIKKRGKVKWQDAKKALDL